MSPAQLYRFEGTTCSADTAYDSATRGTTTALRLARKGTPSLYGALTAVHGSSGGENLVGGDGAFKMMDRLVVGVGFRLRQDQSVNSAAAGVEAVQALASVAALIKAEHYEAGLAYWQGQLRLTEPKTVSSLRATLLHSRWWLQPPLALGLLARLAPHEQTLVPSPGTLSTEQQWSYGASIEASTGAWKGEALYTIVAPFGSRQQATPERTQQALLLVYYTLDPEWTVNLRFATEVGGTSSKSELLSQNLYSEVHGPSAGPAVGLGCTRRL